MKKISHLYRTSKRIEVRPLSKNDYDSWKEFYLTLSPPKNLWDLSPKNLNELTKIKFSQLLKSHKKLRETDKYYDLSVFEKESQKMIGRVSAMDVCRSLSQTAYLGYFIHNNFWSKGYGKESTLMMIDIAFKDLKLHRIEAGIEPNNRRSIFLAKSIGLRKEGLKKKMVYLRGKWQDLTMYSATCEEFGIKWKGIPKTRKT